MQMNSRTLAVVLITMGVVVAGISFPAAVNAAGNVNRIGFVRVGITGVASKAYRATNVESILQSTGDIEKAAAVAAELQKLGLHAEGSEETGP